MIYKYQEQYKETCIVIAQLIQHELRVTKELVRQHPETFLKCQLLYWMIFPSSAKAPAQLSWAELALFSSETDKRL